MAARDFPLQQSGRADMQAGLQGFLRRRAREAAGICLFLGALFGLGLLLSESGFAKDLFWQGRLLFLFGGAAWILPPVLMISGVRLMRGARVSWPRLRGAALIGGFLPALIAAGAADWGGTSGQFLFDLTAFLAPEAAASSLFMPVALVLSAALFLFALPETTVLTGLFLFSARLPARLKPRKGLRFFMHALRAKTPAKPESPARQTQKSARPLRRKPPRKKRFWRRSAKKRATAPRLPPLSLLGAAKKGAAGEQSQRMIELTAERLSSTLEDFGVSGTIRGYKTGPVVTLFEFEPAPGVKSSRVIALADDIARSMSALSARVAVIAGQNAIGIELPNPARRIVHLRDLLEDARFTSEETALPLALGATISGDPVTADLAAMPHLLIAGTTGSGKSVGVNAMILSLLYRLPPSACRLIMIDPKMLELSVYEGIPHLLAPVVTDPKKAVASLKWTVREMETRYKTMSECGVRNIGGYNDKMGGKAPAMPYIVVVIDEMADLMLVAGKEIEAAVQRLAQMARAAGIHLITATQRPSVDVITGTIKANFPTRISFQVTSRIDSRTILGEQGAEQLLGKGDMLFMAGGGRVQRVHGPFVRDKDVVEIVAFLRRQGAPVYLEEVTRLPEKEESGVLGEGEGDLYQQAVVIVREAGRASTSFLQRKLQIGYNRAARLIEQMENEGVVSPPNHSGKREVVPGS